jgi:hypothetical protein
MRGRGRKRKMAPALDRIIQRTVRVDRRKTTSAIKYEIEREREREREIIVIIHAKSVQIDLMKSVFMADSHVKNRTWVRTITRNGSSTRKRWWISHLTIGGLFYGLTSQSSTISTQMERSWSGSVSSGMEWENLCFIECTMDRFDYRTILDKSLKESTNKLGLGIKCIFQQDNDPKHTSPIVTKWLQEKKIETLKYPS